MNAARFAVLGLLTLLAACSDIQTRHRDWSDYAGPGAEEFRKAEPPQVLALPDPLQPANRALYEFNIGVLDYAVQPASRGWRAITSQSVRRHVGQFGDNLAFPVRLAGNLLQARWRRAGLETGRFLINSTAGLLGFFDPAANWGLAAPHAEDVGQAFGAWGWERPAYLQLPFAGPSSERDATGLVFDLLLDPATYLFPLKPLLAFNGLSDEVDGMLRVEDSAGDGYEVVRTAWSLWRGHEVVDFTADVTVTPELRTLQAVFVDAQDPEFVQRRRSLAVVVPATGRELPFELWLQDQPAPLVYVLPGLGGHRLSGSPVAVAELAFRAGCSAVTISSTMHPEFMALAASGTLPGYVPASAADAGAALAAIDADLVARFPGAITRRGLAGLSLGALEALFIATDPGGASYDATLAINPPISLEHGLKQLDWLYRAPLEWPEAEREARIRNLLLKVVHLSQGSLEPTTELPFEPLEAEYLIGLSFRLWLESVIFESQWRAPNGVLLTELSRTDREPAYREIIEYGYMEYAAAFVLPAEQSRDATLLDLADLFARCDLASRTAQLAADPRLRVLTNRDDFLLEPGDVGWLQSTFGERLALFDHGGHLGNLGLPGVRIMVLETLRQALGVSAAAAPAPPQLMLQIPEA